MSLLEKGKAYQDLAIQWRRNLHAHPEVGLFNPWTQNYLAEELKKMGLEPKLYETCTGISVVIEGTTKGKGRVIGLRADTDALPMDDEKDVEYRSVFPGAAHSCGHDANTTMLLTVAKILSENRDLIEGTVKLVFQPGEEGPAGARYMIEEGVLENPKVDAMICQHAGRSVDYVEKGQVVMSYGPTMAAADRFHVKVFGKGCHGANPLGGVDPIVASAEIISALQTIASRETSLAEPCVVTVGSIHGGSMGNSIPEVVEMEGTIRTLTPETRTRIQRRVKEVIEGVATALNCTVETVIDSGYPPVVCNKDLAIKVAKSAAKVLGEDNVVDQQNPNMGGEDAAYYFEKVPGCYYSFCNKDRGTPAHHHPQFDLDDSLLWLGATVMAQAALDFLAE